MKKRLQVLVIVFSFLFSCFVEAADSKLKVVGTMAGYGVVGGALLGTASLAFGTSGRAIAKGASLGLYAGLIFGAYVITSYELKKRGYGESREDYYPDSQGPYENQSMNSKGPDYYQTASEEVKNTSAQEPIFFMNLFTYQF